jgi:hypothetical protein
MQRSAQVLALSILAVMVFAAPGAAQESATARRSFAFFDRNLTLEVAGDHGGVLHVIRGGRSRVEVAARAEDGVGGFALGGMSGDRLRLGAAGDGPVEYVVTVPEQVFLHVQLPDRGYPVLAENAPASTYRWAGQAEAHGPGSPAEVFPTYSDAAAPRELVFTDRAALRRLSFRVQPGDFRIETSTPLQLTPGRRDRIEIRPAGEPMDFVVVIPSDTPEFTARVGDTIALSIRQGVVHAACAPVVQQTLADGRRGIDYTPNRGWTCERR